MWRRRSNLELYQLYKESDIANFIKSQRIKWAGLAVRMDEDRTTKKSSMPNQLAYGERASQIFDGLILEKDLRVLRTKTWRTLAIRRLAWKRFLEKIKAHPGLSSH
ncbi:uncharacterized protein TNCV_1436961 [Trichonephila clavipes]|nr:uncharacterized protein TNCV_1436961 [Trichonephila clavipes]